MSKPVVAIVGRPNVGKSTLFNRIIRSRTAIVEGRPGVTRDRIYGEAEWLSQYFTLVDTGGIDWDEDIIATEVRTQAMVAVEQADVIIFVVDGRSGVTATDEEIAEILRRQQKPVVLCVSKVEDAQESWAIAADFYGLSLGEPILVSAEHGRNVGDLLDRVVEHFPEGADTEEDDSLKIALVGRPNVGKSSLVNRILGEQRVIVTDIPGTTRDAVDTKLTYGDQEITLIDTAGLRRRSRISENVEYYSVMRTLGAVDRSDVTVVMIDGVEGLTEQDKRIAGYAHEKGRGIILAVNKWDLVAKETNTMRDYELAIYEGLPFLRYAPIVFISALTGQRVHRLLDMANTVNEARNMRIPTGRFNQILQDAVAMNQPPSDKGVPLKIYYGSQVQVKPPVFVLHVNRKDLLHFSYERYLENRIRQEYEFIGTPIMLVAKERSG
ncbi:MAG: ribosome biogenesis GTPase Der [Firmicutes bacterium]|jgi:GTP-binding protein|nr:ribosome biogenesis GTPase Der [Bacillota bacterium]NLO65840.1 ribosome biogenesis GTPase Der [Bacillota bacterium]